MNICANCGLEENHEVHDSGNVWFHHYFYAGDLEQILAEKMAKDIAKEVDENIFKDLIIPQSTHKIFAKWKIHPLTYMTDLTDCQNESVELHPKERSILPSRFTCHAMGPKDYDDPWEPHPFGLEDEPWHETDLRQIRANERWRAEQERKKLPWLLRILSR